MDTPRPAAGMTLIATFVDGSSLWFGPGLFDNWCVYSKHGVAHRALRDEEYFTDLAALAKVHGQARLYLDFVAVYERTTAIVEPAVLVALIPSLAAEYGQDAERMRVLFTVLYATMVAEENRTGVPLKKRLKRLGVHQLLVEGLSAQEAAAWSRNRPWRELQAECEARGF